MAGKAVTLLERILRSRGPALLRTPCFSHYHKVTRKAVMGSRLQAAGRGGEGDAHNTGRALDIIVYAREPPQFEKVSIERTIGYRLVDAFMQAREDMRWNLMIYDQEQWDENGISSVRIAKPGTTGMAKVDHEHLTHIHIQFAMADKDFDEFEDALVGWLENPYR